MKRDWELVRKLLIFFRDKEGPEMVMVPPIEGYDDIGIQYHCILLYDAGFLHAGRHMTKDGRLIRVAPFDLTWNGHEFAEKILDEKTWTEIKETVSSKGSALVFGVINALATHLAMKAAGVQ